MIVVGDETAPVRRFNISKSTLRRALVSAAVAAAMLMYDILLTRVCALRFFFHFAFLVINFVLYSVFHGSYKQNWPIIVIKKALQFKV